jgi:hypothetical protein
MVVMQIRVVDIKTRPTVMQQKGFADAKHFFATTKDNFTIKVYKFDSGSLSQTATCAEIVFI